MFLHAINEAKCIIRTTMGNSMTLRANILSMTSLLWWLMLPSGVEGQTKIAKSGSTAISATSAGHQATVTIQSVTVAATSSCANSRLRRAIAEYGASEVTMIDAVEITLDHRNLFVPPSAYLTIFDAKRASLSFEKGSFVLKVDAGDGADSAFRLVYFDKNGVNRSTTYDYEFPERPVEDTSYSHLVIN